MKPYPDRDAILKRLTARLDGLADEFADLVFRFVNPKRSSTAELFAGKGGLFANGRWSSKGTGLVVYTAFTPETALAESLAASRYFGFPLQSSTPIVLVTARAKLKRVIDLRDGAIRQRLRIAEKTILDCDWRAENRNGVESVTQAWGWAFIEAGADGVIARSAAQPGGANLIAFPANFGKGSQLKVEKEVEWPRT